MQCVQIATKLLLYNNSSKSAIFSTKIQNLLRKLTIKIMDRKTENNFILEYTKHVYRHKKITTACWQFFFTLRW